MTADVALGAVDWVLFALLLFFSLCIGVFYAIKDSGVVQKIKSKVKPVPEAVDLNGNAGISSAKNAKEEYLVGGRKMKVFPVCMSMMASFLSAILVIGTPAEIYENGFQFWFFISGLLLSIVFVSHGVLPVIYDLNLTSAYEYLEIRFKSKWPRRVGASIFVLETLLYMGAAMFAPAVALEGVTKFNAYISMAILGVICTIYTSIGGIKAVIWTDVLQMAIMFIGLVAVLIKGSNMIEGGFPQIWEIARENGRAKLFDADIDPRVRHSVGALLIGSFFIWINKYGFNQSSVQRYSSLPSRKKAVVTMYLNGPGVTVMHVMASMCGLILYATFSRCDLKSAGEISSNNQMILYFVVKFLKESKGMAGLFTAAIFAGALSTISSGLNSLAAIVCEDVLGERYFRRHSQQRQMRTMLCLSAFFGVAATAMAFAAKNLSGNIVAITFQFVSITSGPSGGLFLSGLLFPSAEWIGATTGCLFSLGVAAWLFMGQRLTSPVMATSLLPVYTSGCDKFNLTTSVTLAKTAATRTTTEPYPLENSLYSISYLYWPMIANLATLLVAFVIGEIFACLARRRERTRQTVIPSYVDDVIPSYVDGGNGGESACEKCLGSGQHSGSSVDPKLLSPLVRWMHEKAPSKTEDEFGPNGVVSTKF